MSGQNKQCPEFPFFGASYPDARCINGYLWDLDDCHRFIVFLPKKSTIGSKNPIMGILEENRTFISSRPGCILCRLDEMESWAYLDDLLP